MEKAPLEKPLTEKYVDEILAVMPIEDAADMTKYFNKALDLAKASNCPVIYGYQGVDPRTGQHCQLAVNPIICEDETTQADVKAFENKYHPTGSIYVAYPKAEYPTDTLEEDDMSDEELAEKFLCR